jgi:hypothetical protein
MSSLGDAKSSLSDAKSSLGDAKSSLGDAKSYRWVTFRWRRCTRAWRTPRTRRCGLVVPRATRSERAHLWGSPIQSLAYLQGLRSGCSFSVGKIFGPEIPVRFPIFRVSNKNGAFSAKTLD